MAGKKKFNNKGKDIKFISITNNNTNKAKIRKMEKSNIYSVFDKNLGAHIFSFIIFYLHFFFAAIKFYCKVLDMDEEETSSLGHKR